MPRPAYKLTVPQVGRQVKQLRVVLDSAQAKEKEREWLANQKTGELDDAKLVVRACALQ
jgi:hypothetical protein